MTKTLNLGSAQAQSANIYGYILIYDHDPREIDGKDGVYLVQRYNGGVFEYSPRMKECLRYQNEWWAGRLLFIIRYCSPLPT